MIFRQCPEIGGYKSAIFALLLINSLVMISNESATASNIFLTSTQKLAQNSVEQTVIGVSGVRINKTDKGIEVILQANAANKLQVVNRSQGNNFIVDISKAQLRLPERDQFNQDKPVEGIASVTLTKQDDNTIRLTVKGEASIPKVELFDSKEGLIFALTPAEPSVAQQPEAERAQTDKPSQQNAETDEPIELVVTATRTEEELENVPRSVTVINREQIDKLTSVSSNNTLTDLLGKVVPGYSPPNLTSRRNTNQKLRGRPPLILIDGVAQTPNFRIGNDLNVIDPSAIERIEVVRGPSAIYGNGATGGIINIITRKPSEERLQTRLSIGVRNNIGDLPEDGFGYKLQYGFSGKEGNVDYLLSTSLDRNNKFYDANGDVIPFEELTNTTTLNLLTKVGIELNDEQRLEASYNIYNDRINSDIVPDETVLLEPGLQTARAINRGKLDYENQPRQNNQVARINYRHNNVFGSEVDAIVFYQRTKFDQIAQDGRFLFSALLPPGTPIPPQLPSIRQNRQDSEKWGSRLQIKTPFSDRASLLWGVDYTREENNSTQSIIDPVAFDERGEVNSTGSSPFVPQFSIESLGLFAQAQWDATPKLLLSGGLRYENISADIEEFVGSPFQVQNVLGLLQGRPLPVIEGGSNDAEDIVFNAGIVYKATPEISLFANFAQGFTVPSLEVISNAQTGFDVSSGDLIEPEKVDNYEIGLRGKWDNIQASIAGFYNYSANGQNLSLGDEGITLLGRAPQRNYGVEATVDWQPSSIWGLGGTVSWIEGETNFVGDDRGFVPLSSLDVQGLKITAYIENETLPNWRNRLRLLYVGNRDRAFDESVDEFKIDGYTTLDFISTLKLSKGQLQLGIENLLNRQYLPYESQSSIGLFEFRRFPAPGRTVSLTYQVEF